MAPKGPKGLKGPKGAAGTNGTNGTIAPLSAKVALTELPTAAPLTSVVELAVPAGNYVVMAKTPCSCKVSVANGSATNSSLIAIPTA